MYFNSRKLKGYRSVGISRTPRWNVWNGGHEWANHPLRRALISNYLIKICLRRGASYAPFELVLHLLLVSKNTIVVEREGGGGCSGLQRVGGRSNEPTKIRRAGKKRSHVHTRMYANFTIRLDKDRREISARLLKTFQSLLKILSLRK